MLMLKKGKQLPRGVLDKLAAELERDRSEVTARMKFAEKYPTDAKLTDAISKFPNWYAMTHLGGLKDTPPRVVDQGRAEGTDREAGELDESVASHEDQGGAVADIQPDHRRMQKNLRSAITFVENIDPATLDKGSHELLAQLGQAIRKIEEGVRLLKAA